MVVNLVLGKEVEGDGIMERCYVPANLGWWLVWTRVFLRAWRWSPVVLPAPVGERVLQSPVKGS